MKSNPKPSKTGSFQLLKSPSSHSRKVRKTKSMTPELPKSKSRKISTDQVPRQSSRLSEKLENSTESAVKSTATKRRVLSDAPVKTKRFKYSPVKSVQDIEADLDDLSKEANGKENEAQAGVELSLRSDNRPVILTPAAHMRNNKGEVKVVDPEVNGSADNLQEIVNNNDASMESGIVAASPPTGLNESEILLCTFEVSGDEESKTFAAVWNETDWIYLVEQPNLARSPVGSDEGRTSGDLESEPVDVETASYEMDTEEDDDIGNHPNPTGQDIEANQNDMENHNVSDLESVLGPESSSGKRDVLSLEESKTDGNDAENFPVNLEPEDLIHVKSSEELNAQAHNPRSLNFNKESTMSLSISNLPSSINFEETDAESSTSEDVDMETVAEKLQIDAENYLSAGITLLNEDQEMEQDDENSADSAGDPNGTSDVDMTSQAMTLGSQIIHDAGTNETSLDESSLAGPSNRVENLSASSFMMPQDSERIHQYQRVTKIERVVPASDGKETVLTHESVRNYILYLSSGRDAPCVSCPEVNLLDSLLENEGDEELERITMAWYESQLRMPQSNSGQNGWSQQNDDNNELYVAAMVLVFFILFIARHLIEALPF